MLLLEKMEKKNTLPSLLFNIPLSFIIPHSYSSCNSASPVALVLYSPTAHFIFLMFYIPFIVMTSSFCLPFIHYPKKNHSIFWSINNSIKLLLKFDFTHHVHHFVLQMDSYLSIDIELEIMK